VAKWIRHPTAMKVSGAKSPSIFLFLSVISVQRKKGHQIQKDMAK
jgi:hypothetical protein